MPGVADGRGRGHQSLLMFLLSKLLSCSLSSLLIRLVVIKVLSSRYDCSLHYPQSFMYFHYFLHVGIWGRRAFVSRCLGMLAF